MIKENPPELSRGFMRDVWYYSLYALQVSNLYNYAPEA